MDHEMHMNFTNPYGEQSHGKNPFSLRRGLLRIRRTVRRKPGIEERCRTPRAGVFRHSRTVRVVLVSVPGRLHLEDRADLAAEQDPRRREGRRHEQHGPHAERTGGHRAGTQDLRQFENRPRDREKRRFLRQDQ